MKPRLILHAGLHKTGTTAIQSFCAGNRDGLYQKGIWYPDYQPIRQSRPRTHHDIASAVAEDTTWENFTYQEVKQLISFWKEHAGDTVIFLSSEKICRYLSPDTSRDWKLRRLTYLQNFADLFQDFEVEPVLILRRQDDFIHSAYLENLHKGTREGTLTFPEFRELSLKTRLRYADNLDAFKQAFGHVKVFWYEDLKEGNKLHLNLFKELEFNVDEFDPPGTVRKSINYEHGVVKRKLNKLIFRLQPNLFRRAVNKVTNSILSSSFIRAVLSKLTSSDSKSFWQSEEEKKEFLALFDEENKKIRENYLAENANLFTESRHKSTNSSENEEINQ